MENLDSKATINKIRIYEPSTEKYSKDDYLELKSILPIMEERQDKNGDTFFVTHIKNEEHRLEILKILHQKKVQYIEVIGKIET